MTQIYKDELAQLYDVAVPDWPGEIAFYQRLIHQVPSTHPASLRSPVALAGLPRSWLARMPHSSALTCLTK